MVLLKRPLLTYHRLFFALRVGPFRILRPIVISTTTLWYHLRLPAPRWYQLPHPYSSALSVNEHFHE